MNKTFKRIFSSLMVVAMLLTAAPLSGIAELDLQGVFGVSASAESYSGTYGENITWSFNKETGELVISGTGEMPDIEDVLDTDDYYKYYKAVLPYIFMMDEVTKLTINEGITNIYDYAFNGFKSLKSISIPDSVVSIGIGAFDDTAYYSDASNWDNGVLYIDDCLIAGSGVTGKYIVRENTRVIADYALYYCYDLTGIVLNDGIVGVGNYALPTHELEGLTIPDGIIYIGDYAFLGMDNVTDLIIPDSVKTIGSCAFESDYNTVHIGKGVENIDPKFLAYSDFTDIIVDPENKYLSIDENNILFNEDKTELIGALDRYCVEVYKIPDTVTKIADRAFYDCYGLKEVIFGDNVQIIGEWAFENCVYLESVTFADSLTTIGERAFGDCRRLKSLTIPGSVRTIGQYAFWGCYDVESLTIHEGVTYIGDYAFESIDDITELVIPDSVTYIGDHAFGGVDGITYLVIPDSVTYLGDCNFNYSDKLENIEIGDGIEYIGCNVFDGTPYFLESSNWDSDVLYIGQYLIKAKSDLVGSCTIKDGTKIIADEAFYGCHDLTTVEIPDSVKSIGYGAFSGCTSLTDVEIPDSVETIGDGAFVDCGFTTLEIPDGVKTIGEYAFAGCMELTDISIPASVIDIGEGAFTYSWKLRNITVDPENENYVTDEYGVLYNRDKSALYAYPAASTATEYVIPDTVTLIGVAAFIGASNLNKVEIPNSVIMICGDAFEGSGLTSVFIPGSVRIVGRYAFVDCDNLTEAVLEEGIFFVDYSGMNMFAGCDNLKTVKLPSSLNYINEEMFRNCRSLESIEIGNGIELVSSYAFGACESLTDVYYNGTEEEWNEIEILDGNEPLLNANIHFLGGHDWDTITVPSTCKVQGVSYDICLDCGDIQNYTVLPLAEHTWSEWTVVTEATTELEGLERRTCSVCGETEDRTIPKLNKLVDDKSGVEIIYEDEYDSGIEIVVTDVYDGNSFNLIDKHFGSSKSVIFDITTVKDGQKVQPSGKVKVRIPLPDGYGTKGVYIVYIDPTSGKLEKLNATIVDGYIEFVTDHFSYYAVVEKLGKVNSVAIDNISMNYKDSATVTPTISVDAGVKYTVSYSSSDNGVATVDANGKVTATGKGSATITVTVTDQYGNTVTDTCKVDVKYTWWQWIIVIVLFGWIWY